jgi:hypothetical protein
VNNAEGRVSIARMKSPAGWVEPGQTPKFDEYTVVLRGTLRVESRGAGGAVSTDVAAGQAVLVKGGSGCGIHRRMERSMWQCVCRRFRRGR